MLNPVLQGKPDDSIHWSTRRISRETGLSAASVIRIWHVFGISRTWKRPSSFLLTVVYRQGARHRWALLEPTRTSLGAMRDERSQIQALNRTQLGLTLSPGNPATRTRGYKRHRSTSLFAALDVATDEVIGRLKLQHYITELLAFLREIDTPVPADMLIHLIMENYAIHKTDKVRSWFAARQRYHIHFTTPRHPG